ncbi:MAG: 30S ribosomal protein S21 [Planctomycetota bacterium]
MIRVQVRPNEPLEAALRRFKRQCNYSGIFRLAKKYAYHEKRSDKRRREERERLRNILIAERRRGGTTGKRPNKKRRGGGRSTGGRGRSGEADFDPLTADTTVQKPATPATVTPRVGTGVRTTIAAPAATVAE